MSPHEEAPVLRPVLQDGGSKVSNPPLPGDIYTPRSCARAGKRSFFQFEMPFHLGIVVTACVSVWGVALVFAQDASPGGLQPTGAQAPSYAATQNPLVQEPPDKRVFGVLPNYRTANDTGAYAPITTRQKFIIASKDSFDYPLVLLAGAIAGLGQLTNQNPSFGQGMAGYGRRLGTGYADQAIGNLMTEGFFPAFLREDPRYFRRGHGSKRSRIWYAATRVFINRTDQGNWRFNYSELLGNATGVAISNVYEPDGRNAVDNITKLAEQIGIDSVSQILKEFWPDIKHRLSNRSSETPNPVSH